MKIAWCFISWGISVFLLIVAECLVKNEAARDILTKSYIHLAVYYIVATLIYFMCLEGGYIQ